MPAGLFAGTCNVRRLPQASKRAVAAGPTSAMTIGRRVAIANRDGFQTLRGADHQLQRLVRPGGDARHVPRRHKRPQRKADH